MNLTVPGEGSYLLRNDLRAVQKRRVRLILLACGLLLAGISAIWGVFFSLRGTWHIVAMDVLMVAVGLAVVVLTRRERMRTAAWLLIPSLYVTLFFMAAVFDIPSAQVPRSAHLYLLVLAFGSYLILQLEPGWLRHSVPVLCFLTFLYFASTSGGLVTPYAMPDSVRTTGTWVNNGLALLCLYVLLVLMQADVTARTALESDFRRALPERQLLLHYQPQVDTDGRVIGAEALLRWAHPQRGMVPPGEFIPLAERTGLILPIGQWVLETACNQLVAWSRQPETAALTLAVNVSARQFHQADFAGQVLSVVEHSRIDPTRLKLELTESLLVRDIGDIITKMTLLKARGIGFSLDDFGTGYSSLSYLKRLPLDQLKIDQSFVRDVLTDPNDAAIARTVITLGQSLGLMVIAEGVETEGQCEFLRANGCHAFQGYLFSRPLPALVFDAFVKNHRLQPSQGPAQYTQ